MQRSLTCAFALVLGLVATTFASAPAAAQQGPS